MYACILSLVTRHAKRMRRIMSCVACLALHIFPHYLISGTIFDKTLLKIQRVFCFSLQMLSEALPFLRRTERGMIKNYFGVHVKHPSFLSEFNGS